MRITEYMIKPSSNLCRFAKNVRSEFVPSNHPINGLLNGETKPWWNAFCSGKHLMDKYWRYLDGLGECPLSADMLNGSLKWIHCRSSFVRRIINLRLPIVNSRKQIKLQLS